MTVYYRLMRLMALSACLFGCGCSTITRLFEEEEPIDTSAVAQWWDGPRIRPGVGLVVQVAAIGQDKPIVMETQVDQNGQVTLPYLLQAPVVCDGLTLEAFKKKVTKAYQEYIRQPQISVQFAPFDMRLGVSPYGTVNVLGEVMNPGPVNMPPTMDLSVTKAIQAAGGLKPFADRERIRVTRCEKDGTQTRTMVSLVEIGEKGRIDKDLVLKPGDIVYCHEIRW